MSLRGLAAIVGIGETKVGKFPGTTAMQLQSAAARSAIEDSGVLPRSIDALFVKPTNEEPVFGHALTFAELMGIRPSFALGVDSVGATCVSMLASAAAGIAAGLFKTALCVAGGPDASFRRRQPGVGTLRAMEEIDHPHGSFGAIPRFALVARRHMAQYGTTNRQLAAIAVAAREHASLNGNAYKRTPISVDDVLESRWISEPLHLLDCSVPVDGAGAFIVTAADVARDLRKPPVYILGVGGHATHRTPAATPLDSSYPIAESARQAFTMAGLSPGDVDVAELYDCFTITTLVQLEELGFCEPGEGGPFVEDGNIGRGGTIPVNTHGGLLSQGHVDGMLHVLEATRQVRAEGGDRQVAACDVALVTGVGGTISSHATAILATQPSV